MLLLGLFVFSQTIYAQQGQERTITIKELFELTKENHPNLKVSKTDIAIAKQDVEVAKNAQLPTLNAALQGYYLGDAHIIDKDFSNSTRVDMPHFGNTFSIDASQLIWKGGMVKNGIKAQSLKEELTELNYQSNEQSIKLLVLGYYLDLYQLLNQKSVYQQNIQLAEQRLQNINKFYNQGMVTRNDVIRGELQLSNLKLALQVVENNRQILNKQLTTALGLSENTQIVPDETILSNVPKALLMEDYRAFAQNHPTILMTKKAVDIYETSEKITRAEMMPSLSAFAGNQLARPITTSTPALDMYTNGWSAGLSLNFNIDALYKTPKKIKQVRFEKDKAIAQANEAEQMIDVAVNAAYIKYNEAVTQNNTLETNKELSDENYRIMNSKYNNQLAILLDLIDASNQKLDAELQFANSEISIVYAYYKLLKESGNL
ncbi:Outer membrane efflux protein BepC precursor [Sphingobacterium multivorum]|uniref:Outer membrane protein TolC n=7 Tax=Bacteroidota TaxID=976 RepID=A0A1W1YKC5_9FLAO|nr:Outer membrane protein TolC [Moheibacter sediminis]SPZ94562.1 Outer membrane efflux protein BepC precursor [Sphingobacterium multivorum]SUJ02611.1 Outer membrane efflux protein BepC precursor [Sphingobacterium spiritivorum]VEE06144.1 Outer membrane efflux protein BepC precursor [Chryseobacterium gleum]VEH21555.1 Outer membrane efflux protein BepC precursor [Chryseobacterium nakagawai]